MKKIFLIILLCFVIAFAALAIDMSPHPGDNIETVFTVQDNVVISQAVSPPVDVLYFESFNINNANEICISAEANDKAIYYGPAIDAVAVSYIGYEMGIDNLYKTSEDVAIYKIEFG